MHFYISTILHFYISTLPHFYISIFPHFHTSFPFFHRSTFLHVFPPRCKINTAQPFTISHYQNSGQANTWMGQGGQDASFNMCNDGGYLGNMATSYDGMVFTASLWGGGGIDMGWLDGMTGCWGDCNIDGASVTFSNFELWE